VLVISAMLAASRRPEHDQELARGDFERELGDHLDVAEALADTHQLDAAQIDLRIEDALFVLAGKLPVAAIRRQCSTRQCNFALLLLLLVLPSS
jgi:hypothetical protein